MAPALLLHAVLLQLTLGPAVVGS
ncbi:hypothetical protein CIB84_013172 [Bambusicola thoracicus]|uniref:Uncharacterized protein n=1 Tax=Bambusicola thoracicus TaxID=9083 RepID=A0A2P4SG35_BAMTH|nr:hypothetical protein CIB84_013172 [Bambusicola thoracicus]